MKGAVLDETALVMDERDNVATALDDLPADTTVSRPKTDIADKTGPIVVVEEIPFGHKLAVRTVAKGEDVYKYGEVIGEASQRIEAGEWVHTHNCDSKRGRGDVAVEANGGRS